MGSAGRCRRGRCRERCGEQCRPESILRGASLPDGFAWGQGRKGGVSSLCNGFATARRGRSAESMGREGLPGRFAALFPRSPPSPLAADAAGAGNARRPPPRSPHCPPLAVAVRLPFPCPPGWTVRGGRRMEGRRQGRRECGAHGRRGRARRGRSPSAEESGRVPGVPIPPGTLADGRHGPGRWPMGSAGRSPLPGPLPGAVGGGLPGCVRESMGRGRWRVASGNRWAGNARRTPSRSPPSLPPARRRPSLPLAAVPTFAADARTGWPLAVAVRFPARLPSRMHGAGRCRRGGCTASPDAKRPAWTARDGKARAARRHGRRRGWEALAGNRWGADGWRREGRGRDAAGNVRRPPPSPFPPGTLAECGRDAGGLAARRRHVGGWVAGGLREVGGRGAGGMREGCRGTSAAWGRTGWPMGSGRDAGGEGAGGTRAGCDRVRTVGGWDAAGTRTRRGRDSRRDAGGTRAGWTNPGGAAADYSTGRKRRGKARREGGPIREGLRRFIPRGRLPSARSAARRRSAGGVRYGCRGIDGPGTFAALPLPSRMHGAGPMP